MQILCKKRFWRVKEGITQWFLLLLLLKCAFLKNPKFKIRNRMISYEAVETGKLLLAEPFLDDPFFRRAVILLTQHQLWGSMGFILNRPLEEVRVSEFVPLDVDLPLYYGGPVATNTLHYIHTAGELVDDSILIAPNLWWGGNFEQLKLLLTAKLLPWDEIRFFVGYSGWDAGQLKGEFDEKTWIVAEMDKNYLHQFLEQPDSLRKILRFELGLVSFLFSSLWIH